MWGTWMCSELINELAEMFTAMSCTPMLCSELAELHVVHAMDALRFFVRSNFRLTHLSEQDCRRLHLLHLRNRRCRCFRRSRRPSRLLVVVDVFALINFAALRSRYGSGITVCCRFASN